MVAWPLLDLLLELWRNRRQSGLSPHLLCWAGATTPDLLLWVSRSNHTKSDLSRVQAVVQLSVLQASLATIRQPSVNSWLNNNGDESPQAPRTPKKRSILAGAAPSLSFLPGSRSRRFSLTTLGQAGRVEAMRTVQSELRAIREVSQRHALSHFECLGVVAGYVWPPSVPEAAPDPRTYPNRPVSSNRCLSPARRHSHRHPRHCFFYPPAHEAREYRSQPAQADPEAAACSPEAAA